jgi:hypothetical protein
VTGPRLRDLKPRDGGGQGAGHRVDHERGRQAEALGQQAARHRADADREEEDALVDRHRAAAVGRRRDVGEDDGPADEHERGAGAGDEATADEQRVRRRVGAGEIAGRAHEPAQRQDAAPSDAIGELAGRHGEEEAGQAVHGDGQADGRLADAEAARVEGEDGHDRAEAELVDGHQHAEPDEDPRAARRLRRRSQRTSSPRR